VTFENGGTGQAATVRAGPMFWRVHVFGTRGWAEVRGETAMTVALIGNEPVTHTYPAEDSLGALIGAFAETIASGKPFPVPTEDMLDVAGAFEAAIRSMQTGAPVQVTRD
jgi:predicted dehydrogenase